MLVSKYFVYFMIYSVMGWIYETIFCTIKQSKWDNRGFLYGPLCPIYGVGGVAITIITDMLSGGVTEYAYTWLQVFLVSFLGSIVLEYVTSWGLEKLFHAYWWDYSNMPLNIKGRVCLPCSIAFGFAGLLVVYVIAPFVRNLTDQISPLGYEILGLLLMCLISVDTTLTVVALTRFEDIIDEMDRTINAHLDQFVENIVDKNYPSAKELLEEGKQTVAARLAEERERFTKERAEHVYGAMSGISKASIRRVKGFRKTKKVEAHRMETALSQLKAFLNNVHKS